MLALIAGAFAGWVWFASEAHLKSFPPPPLFSMQIPKDEASISRGEHLVFTRGCRGCHGDELQGQRMWGYAVAPNLPMLAREQSAAAIEAALRHGIAHDGTAMYSMPAFSFMRLRDEDVADIIAYLRSEEFGYRFDPGGLKDPGEPSLPWKIRYDLARGTDQAIPGFLPLVPPLKHAGVDSPIARGEYIAMTTCIECHGFSLHADSPFPGENAPSLVVIAGYDEAAFTHLMRTGKALGERELPMMSGVARGRFVHFTDGEVRDLYAFLHDLAMRAVAGS